MDIMTLEHWIILFSALTGFVVAMYPIRCMLIKLWKKTFGRNRVLLNSILKELLPNGETSMRDAVDRIEQRQSDFDAFLSAQLNIGDKAVFRTDSLGKVISNNRQHQRLTGFSVGEVTGDGWINVLHPKWRKCIHDKWLDAVAEGREFSEDIMYVKPDGEEYMVHVNAYREIDSKGTIRGYLGVVTPLQDEEFICPHMDRCMVAQS